MMPRSSRYRQMQKQLNLLRKHLLPSHFSPTGIYNDRTYSRVISYRIMCHAEFESYLEDRVMEIADKSIRDFQINGTATKSLISMMVFSGRTMIKPPSNFDLKLVTSDKVSYRNHVFAAYNNFHSTVEDNNGIKEKNILALLMPIGITFNDLDNLWLTKMNSYGTIRGALAHSSRLKITSFPDPKDEYKLTKSIVKDLANIDDLINSLLH